MTGLPPPPKGDNNPKKKRKKATKKKTPRKKREPTAQEVQDEVVTADEVIAEVIATAPKFVQPEPHPPEVLRKNKTNNVICCLWRGEDLPGFCNNVYGTTYVVKLLRGMRRTIPNSHLTVLTDDCYYHAVKSHPDLQEVRVEKFYGEGVGGWSRILEVCRPNLRPKMGKRTMWVGLDTVFIRDARWLFEWNESPVGLPIDPLHPPLACNAVWTWNYDGAAYVWDAYEASKADGMKDYLLFGRPSEMVLLRYLYQASNWRPLEYQPKKLLSYKAHVLRGYNPWALSSSVVYFHGNPKPHHLPRQNRVRREWDK